MRRIDGHGTCIPRIAAPETIEIDANGSPVTLAAADWLVCFVPGLRKRWWHGFVSAKHKHVFALRKVDENAWLIVEPWWGRIMVNVLSFDQAVQYLRWAAAGDIIKVREAIPGRGSQTRGWSNCAVLVSFMLGRRYRTWSPHGLYKRLKEERGAQVVDVSRLLVDHCTAVARETSRIVLDVPPRRPDETIDSLLSRIGQAMVQMMLTPAAVGIHKAATSGGGLFAHAADAYRTHSPERVIERLRGLLEDANLRGEIQIPDTFLGARRFVQMLRSDLHHDTAGLAEVAPTVAKTHGYVLSIVNAFLQGTDAARSNSVSNVALPKEIAC